MLVAAVAASDRGCCLLGLMLAQDGGLYSHGVILCFGRYHEVGRQACQAPPVELTQAETGCTCRELLATGGSNPADCQIMRIRNSAGACTSQPVLEPVQTLVVGCCSQVSTTFCSDVFFLQQCAC